MHRALVLLVVAAHAAAAQQIRGVVRDSAAAAPLPGAVVSIIDSSGAVSSRTLTDGSGRFVLTLAPRAARARVIRIGYQPRDVPLPASPSGTLDVAMLRLPAMLDAVHVSGEELCPGSADRGSAFQLWEQARAGLLSAVVAREAKPANMTSLTFTRSLSPNDELVRRQATRVANGRTSRPFVAAASSAQFAAAGYMSEDQTGRTFSAPDADVLLDEAFAAAHCFHLQAADSAHGGQIGLAFTPARNRDDVVDVRGVIWMDAASPALRSFDFRYTELESASIDAGAGGHVDFREMENGVAFIERWVLRLPIPTPVRSAVGVTRSPDPVRRRQDRTGLRVAEISESGGIVLAAKWEDGASWQSPPTGIRGVVVRANDGGPAAHAVVTLVGTRDTVTADARGAFEIAPALPGRYVLSVSDTALRRYSSPREASRRIDVVRGRMAELRLEVAPLRAALERACEGQRILPLTTTIIGHVEVPDSAAWSASRATVRARWQANYNNGSAIGVAAGGVAVNLADQTSDVDDAGRFVVCGVALDRPIQLHYARAQWAGDTTVVVRDSVLSAVAWRLVPGASLRRTFTPARGTQLDTVRSVASSSRSLSPALQGFDERRRTGTGTFITDSVLRAHDDSRLGELLRARAAGMKVVADRTGTYAASARDTRTGKYAIIGGGNGLCYATVYLDGVKVFENEQRGAANPPPDLDQIRVDQLGGIEYYAGASRIPAQFTSSECGVLLLWSRER